MPEDRDDEVDVESLFDAIEDDGGVAGTNAHAAITMRPLGIKRDEPPGTRVAAAQRSELLKAAMPVRSQAEIEMAGIGGAAVVLGVASRTASGVVSTSGAVDGRTEERAAYLARLAVMVGEELGLETLRELHVSGAETRLAWIARPNGSSSTVVARSEADMASIARKLRR